MSEVLRLFFNHSQHNWNQGQESAWLHLPLVCGTEVAVAFEQGDLDRPYIEVRMTLEAEEDMTVNAVNGEMVLSAPQGITLASRGAYNKLKDGSIEIGATGELRLRNDHVQWGGAASLDTALSEMSLQDPVFKKPTLGKFLLRDDPSGEPRPHVAYRIETADGAVVRGVTDSEGYTQAHHGLDSQSFKLNME